MQPAASLPDNQTLSAAETSSVPRDALEAWLRNSAPQEPDGPVVRFARTIAFLDTDDREIVRRARIFELDAQADAAAAAELRSLDLSNGGFVEQDEMARRDRDEAVSGETVLGHVACAFAGGIAGLIVGVAIGWAFL